MRARDFERQARAQPRGARDVERLLADLADTTADDLSDELGVDAGALERSALHRAEQVGGVHRRERTVTPPERGADRFDDDDVVVGEFGHSCSFDGRCSAADRTSWPSATARRREDDPMRTRVLVVGAVLLAACSSGHKTASNPTTTSTAAPSTTTTDTSTTATTATTTPPAGTTSTTLGGSGGTNASAATAPGPTPVTGPASSASSLLAKVTVQTHECLDRVVFDFTTHSHAAPGYTVTYGSPPFVQAATGAPVPIAGNAFVVVKMQPAATYDFESNTATYTGPRHLTVPNASHVRAVAETDDSEGIVTWVIGIDARVHFGVTATGTPNPQLVVTIG